MVCRYCERRPGSDSCRGSSCIVEHAASTLSGLFVLPHYFVRTVVFRKSSTDHPKIYHWNMLVRIHLVHAAVVRIHCG